MLSTIYGRTDIRRKKESDGGWGTEGDREEVRENGGMDGEDRERRRGEREAERLYAKFHLNVFGFRWPKTTIFGKF